MNDLGYILDIGDILRRGRHSCGMSQMTLALDCGISSRHLSFIETGRARPSRDVALRLADSLRLSPHQRNQLLRAAGLAPEPAANTFETKRDMASAVQAASRFIAAADPYPAVAIDRRWNLVAQNAASSILLHGGDDALMQSPINVLRLWLHPRGISSRVLNLTEWRRHLIRYFEHQIDRNQDDDLRPMLEEMQVYAGSEAPSGQRLSPELTVPLRIRVEGQEQPLQFTGATTLFGGPDDVHCSQIAIASFLPADANTRSVLNRFHAAPAC